MSLLLESFNYEDDTKTMKEMVEQVKNRLNDCKLTLKPRTDYEFLSKFIRLRKYNVEDAVTAVCRYYNGIWTHFEKFNDLVVSDISHVYKPGPVTFLKTKVQDKSIGLLRVSQWNTDKMTLNEVALSCAFAYEELFKDRDFLEKGGVIILDLTGLTFRHVTHCGYNRIKFCLKIIFDIYQVRVASLHFVKPPLLFWPIFKIIDKFMPAKIRTRVNFHSEVNTLFDFLPAEVLPKCIGGNLDDNEAYDEIICSDLIQKNTKHASYWKVDLNKER